MYIRHFFSLPVHPVWQLPSIPGQPSRQTLGEIVSRHGGQTPPVNKCIGKLVYIIKIFFKIIYEVLHCSKRLYFFNMCWQGFAFNGYRSKFGNSICLGTFIFMFVQPRPCCARNPSDQRKVPSPTVYSTWDI